MIGGIDLVAFFIFSVCLATVMFGIIPVTVFLASSGISLADRIKHGKRAKYTIHEPKNKIDLPGGDFVPST